MAERTEEDIKLMMQIAQRVEELRLKTGLTQSGFAKEHGIDRQAIARWESKANKRGITIYTVKKFCNMIGVSLQEFFDSELFNS